MDRRKGTDMRGCVVVFALSLALPFACGKEKAPASTPPTAPADDGGTPSDDAAGDAGADASAKTWDEMSWDDRKQHMMHEVTPKMADLFRGLAPEHYAEFNCVTCHGPGAKQGEFDMPSPSLPKLPPGGDFAKLMETKPDVMKFMGERVVPEMAALLDTAPYDPSTGEGFGCYGCHQASG